MKTGRLLILFLLAVMALTGVSYAFRDKDPIEPEIGQEEPVMEQEEEINEEKEDLLILYAAGQDEREGPLDLYGRIDANLLLCFNQSTGQLLIIGIPRDAYLPNPALNHGLDKLTHLGNQGVANSIQGLEEYLDIEIDHYLLTDFTSFKKVIDILDGIDVNNPYAFSAAGDASQSSYSFEQGLIHLDGDGALAYCRERHELENGDFDRNEHQAIVLKSVLQKLASVSAADALRIAYELQGSLLSDMELSEVAELLLQQDQEEPEIILYSLGGQGDMQTTASMGDQKLYVVHLDEEQISFLQEELDRMSKGKIEQERLPE